jgi:hypothetical protein
MNQFQIPKGQNPLRLPFASFRLIFGLEKTLSVPPLAGQSDEPTNHVNDCFEGAWLHRLRKNSVLAQNLKAL